MKRAIRMKVMSLRRENEICFTDEEPTKLMEMILDHYSLHPILFDGSTLETLCERAWSQVYEVLVAPSHPSTTPIFENQLVLERAFLFAEIS